MPPIHAVIVILCKHNNSYLFQFRDKKSAIVFHGHCGLFGGGAVGGNVRELKTKGCCITRDTRRNRLHTCRNL